MTDYNYENPFENIADEGPYYDQEMADIIADAAEKEVKEIQDSIRAEARYAEQNGSPAGYEQDL